MTGFAFPWVFALLPLPFLFRAIIPPAQNSQGRALKVPFLKDVTNLRKGGIRRMRFLSSSILLPFIIWCGLVSAAASPQWVGEPMPIKEEGRNILLVVDLSESMQQTDFMYQSNSISRLNAVKLVVSDFIKNRKGDRLGLELFGTRAYLQAPLTTDIDVIDKILMGMDTGLAGKTTSIGDALGLAVKTLKGENASKSIAILLTDGASNSGALSPEQATELATAEGVKTYTIGVGATQMAVGGFFGKQIVNPSADLDETTLKYIAQKTGGTYFRATDLDSLKQIYSEIDKLEPTKGGDLYIKPIKELFYYPLAFSLILSLIWGLSRINKSKGGNHAS